jgi:hypothetical protein
VDVDDTAPYVRLMKLIEAELELVRNRQLHQLRAAVERTGAYMSTLATPAPASAQATLQRAIALRSRVEIEARRARDELQAAQASLRQTRKVVRHYAPPQRRRYSTTA